MHLEQVVSRISGQPGLQQITLAQRDTQLIPTHNVPIDIEIHILGTISATDQGTHPHKVIYLAHRNGEKNEEGTFFSIKVEPLAGAIKVEKGKSPFPTAVDNDFR